MSIPFNVAYATVAASQTKQQVSVGAYDVLERLIIVPASTTAGKVSIFDGSSGTEIAVYTGGTVGADLTPIKVDLGIRSSNLTNKGWCITTGSGISVIAVISFK